MAAHFELKKTTNGQFMFNLKAANGEVILTSATYKAKEGATNGIASVRASAPIDAQFERKTSTDNQHFFVLKAANHEQVGKSELYKTAASMENGIASVKKNAQTATVNDLS